MSTGKRTESKKKDNQWYRKQCTWNVRSTSM